MSSPISSITHPDDTRKNIPTAELQSVLQENEQTPIQVAFERRNPDLDPQLVWRGKDQQQWSDLVVPAPPLFIQEKIHPKVLIDDLIRQSAAEAEPSPDQMDLFGDFNGLPSGDAKTEFYQHEGHWSNRFILGDSLQVMASLAEREGLRGKVQTIYFDPPYGIKFNSNFQWSTTSRDVKDGNATHITREPEQVKAFRDTWRDGINSYLTYLRDRLTVARDLLTESGSIFVQIGDENVHRVRAVMDEVFGEDNFVSQITFIKTSGQSDKLLSAVSDYILWFCKRVESIKYRQIYAERTLEEAMEGAYTKVIDQNLFSRSLSREEKESAVKASKIGRVYRLQSLASQRPAQGNDLRLFNYLGHDYAPGKGTFKTDLNGLNKLSKSGRLEGGGNSLSYVRFADDFSASPISNFWTDTGWSLGAEKTYVVQTGTSVIQRCLLMTTDPGDLVLDPTCGSGTTAYVAEQWGRRFITIDTSRVALALARARLMGAKYPYYLMADSREGQRKEAEASGTAASSAPVHHNIKHGFVYERVPHITLKSIANNAEIDIIWEKWHAVLEPIRAELNAVRGTNWQEWEIPRFAETPWSDKAVKAFETLRKEQEKGENGSGKKQKDAFAVLLSETNRSFTFDTLPERPADPWPAADAEIHARWWEARINRQREMDASIAAKAEYEFLYDKPYEDKKKIRVAGPFTVESLLPHRVISIDENDAFAGEVGTAEDTTPREGAAFVDMILDNLRTSGVQQAHKADKIQFHTLTPWPGKYVCAVGVFGDPQDGKDKRAAIFIGPEFGTVSRPDLAEAAQEAGDAGFDVLITCAFNYDAHTTEFSKLGRLPVLKARMNADLHMAGDLKNTGKGNLFVIFGEPDIDVLDAGDAGSPGQIRILINGVDVFHPNSGEIRSDGPDGIACWFIDTDYNRESFFVRHAYFLGAGDPYKSLKTTLKAEINEEAWASLNRDISRPFDKPKSGRVAVKVINHLGDEVMKVFRV